jgi:hypothetical protein
MRLQDFIHSVEQGGLAKWIIRGVVFAAILAMYAFFIMANFHGLSDARGMEQAQIGREIARGQGFSTKSIRPLALKQLQEGRANKGGFPLARTPDTYHAPLGPIMDSIALQFTRSSWTMSMKEITYPSDRAIATMAVIFFVLGMIVNFLLAKKLFDEQMAGLSLGLTLICDQYWRFSMSGLPQMLMFFLFSCAIYALYHAIIARSQEKPATIWLSVAAVFFGLLALTHALTIWLFIGALIFSAFYFRPRLRDSLIMLAIVCVMYTPWLMRNYRACHDPFGLGIQVIIGCINGSELSTMRNFDTTLEFLTVGAVKSQVKAQIIQQLGGIFIWLGQNPVAPVFFLTLLYMFKRREQSHFQWCFTLMLAFGVFGMCILGLDATNPVHTNNLYILFIPILTVYGFAYVMMHWSRLSINIKVLRYGFIGVIYIISGLPLASTYMSQGRYRVNWPPYIPPFIAILNTWTNENEYIASDMPWAVAWYADRRSLQIPEKMTDFLNIYDWSELRGNLVGLYLTPITGDRALISEIIKGSDKDWAPLILRTVHSKDFPFRASTALPVDGECIFYCETDRWSNKAD